MERCQKCKKKSIVINTCKCLKSVCLQCRYPEDHGCVYDYKEEGKEILRKQNPLILGDKIVKI